MWIKILGSAAGGGFPQWNCNCANCRAVRAGAPDFLARTQSSLAVSAHGADWLIINASPDLSQQIAATPELWPGADGPKRASPVRAVALTNADVDHVAGLLSLRERQAFDLYAAPRVLDTLAGISIFDVLATDLVQRRPLGLDAHTRIVGAGLSLETFVVPGKIALYLEDEGQENFGSRDGDAVGLRVIDEASGKSFCYIPGCARIDTVLRGRLAGAELVLFDGTLWSENEMLKQGLGPKTGSRMGHVVMSGEQGSIAAFATLGVARKVFVHINNTNPVLDRSSKERAAAEAAGWTIGEDGMRFEL